MNAIGTLLHQTQSLKRSPYDTKESDASLSMFHSLLVKEQTEADKEISRHHTNEEMANHGEMLYDLLERLEEMQQNDLVSDESLEKLVNFLIAEADKDAIQHLQLDKQMNSHELADLALQKEIVVLHQKVGSILSQLSNEQDAKKFSIKELPIWRELFGNQTVKVNPDTPLLEELQGDLITLKGSEIEQQFAGLLQKAEMLLRQISTEPDAIKIAPKLLTLLEQWTALEKKSGKENKITDYKAIKNESPKEHSAWKTLLNVFQRRQEFVSQQRYNSVAKVTSTDVAKWIHNALNENSSVEKPSGNHSLSFSSLPMSRVEQHVIYMNQTHTPGSPSADKQLMEQLQKVIKTSRFLSMPNGTSQLSITLRPNNLGEMMVRLTQVNGEMTVKIIVTSDATKEMLQSNIHQLKNMFSPQQVMIERQELNANLNRELNEKQEEQPMKDQDHNQSEHEEREKSQNDDFETHFHDLLMNEKV